VVDFLTLSLLSQEHFTMYRVLDGLCKACEKQLLYPLVATHPTGPMCYYISGDGFVQRFREQEGEHGR
jgi:hypothetical protein